MVSDFESSPKATEVSYQLRFSMFSRESAYVVASISSTNSTFVYQRHLCFIRSWTRAFWPHLPHSLSLSLSIGSHRSSLITTFRSSRHFLRLVSWHQTSDWVTWGRHCRPTLTVFLSLLFSLLSPWFEFIFLISRLSVIAQDLICFGMNFGVFLVCFRHGFTGNISSFLCKMASSAWWLIAILILLSVHSRRPCFQKNILIRSIVLGHFFLPSSCPPLVSFFPINLICFFIRFVKTHFCVFFFDSSSGANVANPPRESHLNASTSSFRREDVWFAEKKTTTTLDVSTCWPRQRPGSGRALSTQNFADESKSNRPKSMPWLNSCNNRLQTMVSSKQAKLPDELSLKICTRIYTCMCVSYTVCGVYDPDFVLYLSGFVGKSFSSRTKLNWNWTELQEIKVGQQSETKLTLNCRSTHAVWSSNFAQLVPCSVYVGCVSACAEVLWSSNKFCQSRSGDLLKKRRRRCIGRKSGLRLMCWPSVSLHEWNWTLHGGNSWSLNCLSGFNHSSDHLFKCMCVCLGSAYLLIHF